MMNTTRPLLNSQSVERGFDTSDRYDEQQFQFGEGLASGVTVAWWTAERRWEGGNMTSCDIRRLTYFGWIPENFSLVEHREILNGILKVWFIYIYQLKSIFIIIIIIIMIRRFFLFLFMEKNWKLNFFILFLVQKFLLLKLLKIEAKQNMYFKKYSWMHFKFQGKSLILTKRIL